MSDIVDKHHYQELAGMDPADVCRRALCDYNRDGGVYTLNIWDYTLRLDPGRCSIGLLDGPPIPPDDYFLLFGMHYLLTARPVDPTGEWISEKDIPGGETFFRGPHQIPTHLISDRFVNDLEALGRRCEALGGRKTDMADAAYVFEITPRIPVAMLYWTGDEDFPAEANLLFDKTLQRHLASDIVYALAVGVCKRLGRC